MGAQPHGLAFLLRAARNQGPIKWVGTRGSRVAGMGVCGTRTQQAKLAVSLVWVQGSYRLSTEKKLGVQAHSTQAGRRPGDPCGCSKAQRAAVDVVPQGVPNYVQVPFFFSFF